VRSLSGGALDVSGGAGRGSTKPLNDSHGHHIIRDGYTRVSDTARVSLRSGQEVQSGTQSAANIAVRRNDRRSLAWDRVLLVNWRYTNVQQAVGVTHQSPINATCERNGRSVSRRRPLPADEPRTRAASWLYSLEQNRTVRKSGQMVDFVTAQSNFHAHSHSAIPL